MESRETDEGVFCSLSGRLDLGVQTLRRAFDNSPTSVLSRDMTFAVFLAWCGSLTLTLTYVSLYTITLTNVSIHTITLTLTKLSIHTITLTVTKVSNHTKTITLPDSEV